MPTFSSPSGGDQFISFIMQSKEITWAVLVFVSFWRRSVYITGSSEEAIKIGSVFVSFWRRSVYIEMQVMKQDNDGVRFSSPSGGDQFISDFENLPNVEIKDGFRLLLAEISLYQTL